MRQLVVAVRELYTSLVRSEPLAQLWRMGRAPWIAGASAVQRSAAVKLARAVVDETTGYASVEKHKGLVILAEQAVADASTEAQRLRVAAQRARDRERKLQGESAQLLERKHTWAEEELARFTQVYRDAAEAARAARAAEADAERALEKRDSTQAALTRAILARYRAEQVWSDKVRAISAWAALCVVVANAVLVLLVQFLAEPWKRKRLVREVEGRLIAREEASIDALRRDILLVAREMEERDVLFQLWSSIQRVYWRIVTFLSGDLYPKILSSLNTLTQSWKYLVLKLKI